MMRLLSLPAAGLALALVTASPALAEAALGTEGDDVYVGTAQADEYDGFAGNDTISGGGGADLLIGGEGDDTISGGAHADYLIGGGGANSLDPGPGVDETAGGTGPDTITLGNDQARDIVQCGGGHDVVILVGGFDVQDEIGVTCEEIRFL